MPSVKHNYASICHVISKALLSKSDMKNEEGTLISCSGHTNRKAVNKTLIKAAFYCLNISGNRDQIFIQQNI